MTKAITEQKIAFTVNGERHLVTAHPMRRLLDLLREDLVLTGTKEGCGEGECGACTVLMEGLPVLSCMVPICQVEGKTVFTIEGLAKGATLHPMQQAFLEKSGTQCGICTPGIIISAVYYSEHPEAAQDMREALAGNQCRCTGYKGVFEALKTIAVEKVAQVPPE